MVNQEKSQDIGGESRKKSGYWLDQRIPAFIQTRLEGLNFKVASSHGTVI